MAKIQDFDKLVSAIQKAFLSVNQVAQNQHIETLNNYLDENGSPKVIKTKYPYFNSNGEIEYRELDIPELCLIPISSLNLSEANVEFKIKLTADFDNSDDLVKSNNKKSILRHSRIGFISGFRHKTDDSYATVTLKFKADEAPEGILRIRDELIKILP